MRFYQENIFQVKLPFGSLDTGQWPRPEIFFSELFEFEIVGLSVGFPPGLTRKNNSLTIKSSKIFQLEMT
jgi:hypothetical protein